MTDAAVIEAVEAHGGRAGPVGQARGSASILRGSPPPLVGGPERQERLIDVPAKYRDGYRKAWAGKSRKAAIRAFCLECTGWSEAEVRLCTATACPLYEFRLTG